MKNLFLFTVGLLFSLSASSQILRPIKWSYTAKKTSATEATVFIKATLQDGWHLYAQENQEGGPVKTTFIFSSDKSYQLKGKVTEPKFISKFEKTFNMNVNYFEKTVVFQQKVRLKGGKAVVKGAVEFMVCSNQQCLPPDTNEFSIPIQ